MTHDDEYGRCMKSGFMARVRRTLMDDVQLGKGVAFCPLEIFSEQNQRFATIRWQGHEFTLE
jgi:hypothetical protein